MSERRRDPAHSREDETRDEQGKDRQEERGASKEAVEEEEQTGGPPTQGDD